MKKALYLVIAFILTISCNSDDNIKSYAEENEAEILQYIEDNNLNVSTDENGLYYIINEQGTGLQPGPQDVVTLSYHGSFLDGTIFDQTDNEGVIFSLQQVITGLAIGTTYLNEGGSAKLIIPSRLAYGDLDYNGIPAGSVIVFDIELISVNFNKENDAEIVQYLADNNLTDDAIKTDSGLYYIIEEEGTGENPTSTDNVTVAYNGYFLDGNSFDNSDSGVSFNLQGVIEGWREGIPYFKEGGKGKLLIPSRLGYGNYTFSTIPGASVLIFDIELLSIN